jgi:hypothetical protein
MESSHQPRQDQDQMEVHQKAGAPQTELLIHAVTVLVVWVVTSLVATVHESRTTWLLLAMIALAGRLAVEEPVRLESCFPDNPTPTINQA